MSEWQPIDTAPKDGTEVLLCSADGVVVIGWLGVGSNRSHPQRRPGLPTHWDPTHWDPTHWMPLPDPPESLIPKMTEATRLIENYATDVYEGRANAAKTARALAELWGVK